MSADVSCVDPRARWRNTEYDHGLYMKISLFFTVHI